MKSWLGLLTGLLVGLFWLWLPGSYSLAQNPLPGVGSWSDPVNISRSRGESTDPAIVADQTGLVHLFWSEEMGGKSGGTPDRQHGDAIAYSRWDGKAWSEPIDVLVSPDGGSVWQPVAVVDRFGVLHVIWASHPSGRLYYSHSSVENAGTAQGWASPLQMGSGMPTLVLPAAIAVDHRGTVHVVYSAYGYATAVMHVESTDGGVTWSVPTPVSADMPVVSEEVLVSGGTALTIDDGDGLHVGWSMYNQDGFGVAVYYACSRDGGQTWSTPLVVGEKAEDDYEADWLNIATVGMDRIFLVWTGIGRPPGRIYRLSTDGGETWTPPTPFMEGMVGETESPRMIVDSASTVHLFTHARVDTGDRTTGIRYLYWTDHGWSAPYLIPGPPPDPRRYGGFRDTATVRLGNQLFDAWYDQALGEILVVHGESGAPALSPVPFDRRIPEPTAAVTPASPTRAETILSLSPSTAPTQSTMVPSSSPLPSQTAERSHAVLAGAISAGFVVGVVLLARLTRERRA